jgi:hypothetical protein
MPLSGFMQHREMEEFKDQHVYIKFCFKWGRMLYKAPKYCKNLLEKGRTNFLEVFQVQKQCDLG